MLDWQDYLSRLGLVLLIALTGNILIVGPLAVGWLWGEDFASITTLLAGGLLAVIPLWMDSQWIRQFLLQRITRVFVVSAIIYAVVLCTLFYLLPVDARGWSPMLALIGAGYVLAIYSAWCARQHGAKLGWLFRFLPAATWLVVAVWAMGPSTFRVDLLLRLLGWNVGLIFCLFIPKALQFSDFRMLWDVIWVRSSR